LVAHSTKLSNTIYGGAMQKTKFIAEQLLKHLENGIAEQHQTQSQDMTDRLLPELAQPFPATALVVWDKSSENKVLPAGIQLEPMKDDSSSIWRTAHDVELHSFDLTAKSIETSEWAKLPKGTKSCIQMIFTHESESPTPRRLRVHLVGELAESFSWFQLLCCSVIGVYARSREKTPIEIKLTPVEYRQSVFAAPIGLPSECRLLNEFFLCPQAFTAFDLSDLPSTNGNLEIVIALSTQTPEHPADLMITRCSIVVNELVRELPMIEIDATRDEWSLSMPDGERLTSVEQVEVYDRESGEWVRYSDWQVVYRSGQPKLAFRTPLFEPTDPPSRYVKVSAKCIKPQSQLNSGWRIESESGIQGTVKKGCISPPIMPVHDGLSKWTVSGFREPLSQDSLKRILLLQAVLDGRVLNSHRCDTTDRQSIIHRMISGLSLKSVEPERYVNQSEEVFYGRRITLQIEPDNFPGGGYWAFVTAIARFLSVQSPFHQFTRVAIQIDSSSEKILLNPLFGRRTTT
jgi:type VI protein secretion system component VasA